MVGRKLLWFEVGCVSCNTSQYFDHLAWSRRPRSKIKPILNLILQFLIGTAHAFIPRHLTWGCRLVYTTISWACIRDMGVLALLTPRRGVGEAWHWPSMARFFNGDRLRCCFSSASASSSSSRPLLPKVGTLSCSSSSLAFSVRAAAINP